MIDSHSTLTAQLLRPPRLPVGSAGEAMAASSVDDLARSFERYLRAGNRSPPTSCGWSVREARASLAIRPQNRPGLDRYLRARSRHRLAAVSSGSVGASRDHLEPMVVAVEGVVLDPAVLDLEEVQGTAVASRHRVVATNAPREAAIMRPLVRCPAWKSAFALATPGGRGPTQSNATCPRRFFVAREEAGDPTING